MIEVKIKPINMGSRDAIEVAMLFSQSLLLLFLRFLRCSRCSVLKPVNCWVLLTLLCKRASLVNSITCNCPCLYKPSPRACPGNVLLPVVVMGKFLGKTKQDKQILFKQILFSAGFQLSSKIVLSLPEAPFSIWLHALAGSLSHWLSIHCMKKHLPSLISLASVSCIQWCPVLISNMTMNSWYIFVLFKIAVFFSGNGLFWNLKSPNLSDLPGIWAFFSYPCNPSFS